MFVGHLAETRQERVARNHVTALAEDRLDDERGHVVRIGQRREQVFDRGHRHVDGRFRRTVANTKRIGKWNEVDASGEWLEMAANPDTTAGQRHRPMSTTVKTAAKRDHQRTSRRDLGELDRGLDRLGARVRQEQANRLAADGPVDRAREVARQPLMQLQPGLVIEDVLLQVDTQGRLVGDGRRDSRMCMTGVRNRDPRREIEIALAVNRLDPRAAGALDHEIGVSRPERSDAIALGQPGIAIDPMLRAELSSCGGPLAAAPE